MECVTKPGSKVYACKLYPAGATTNSDSGVTDIVAMRPVFAEMEACDLPLLLHGEVNDPEVDIFDREAVFIDRVLSWLLDEFPRLRIVLEHVTTKEGVDAVRNGPETLAATITPHHLAYDRNNLLVGGIRPHFYCLPVLKRGNPHRLALVDAATSGHPRFFLGTDSAPHPQREKESACGCAGCYNATAALAIYAKVFEMAGRLEKLEAFASLNGPAFYGLPPNKDQITLVRVRWRMRSALHFGNHIAIPFLAGELLDWQVQGQG